MAKRRRARRKEEAQPGVVTTPKPRAEKTVVFVSLAIVAAVFIVYGQVATHNLTNIDDLKYLPQNYHVTTGLTAANIEWAFTKFYAAYWLPLTWISYMADVQMFGLDPGKILLVNVVLHALNSMFLFLVLRRATNELWRSATVAALFALHPLHVESVAWATERKDVLSTLFFMLTLLSYVLFVEKRSPARYLTMVVCFVLGMMAKPMVITIPFVLLLLDWWPLQRFSLENLRPLRQLIIEKIPLFVLVVPASLITMRAQREAIGSIPLGDRLKNALLSYLVYLGKTIWPANLSVIYPLRIVTGSVAVVAVVVLIAITIAALLGARRKYIPMGWFWYLGTLVPVIGIVQAGKQSMADRFTYIPLIGIFIAAVWLAAEIAVVRRFAPAIAALLLIALGAASFVQASYWKDSVTLERHALAVTRDNDVAHVYLGSALVTNGDRASAEKEFEAAISANANNDEAYRDLARLKLAAHPEEAVPLLRKAIELKPDDTATQAMLSAALGEKQKAVTLFQRALEEGDDTPDVHNDFAAVLAILGQDARALEEYQRALQLMPAHYDAHMNLGALLSRMGRDPEAIEQFEAAAKAHPGASEPHVYLALVHANRGQLVDAINEVSNALSIDATASNREFTNAVRMPFKESNLREYLAFLQQKARG